MAPVAAVSGLYVPAGGGAMILYLACTATAAAPACWRSRRKSTVVWVEPSMRTLAVIGLGRLRVSVVMICPDRPE